MIKYLLYITLTAGLLTGTTLAHAYLSTATPAEGEVVDAAPETLELRFTEPIETRFSFIKVYPLEADENAMPNDLANPTEREIMRLNGLAGQLVSSVLRAEDDDDARADTGMVDTERTSARVSLGLGALAPGVYVVMWDVLSIDTHRTQGNYLFFVAPKATATP